MHGLSQKPAQAHGHVTLGGVIVLPAVPQDVALSFSSEQQCVTRLHDEVDRTKIAAEQRNDDKVPIGAQTLKDNSHVIGPASESRRTQEGSGAKNCTSVISDNSADEMHPTHTGASNSLLTTGTTRQGANISATDCVGNTTLVTVAAPSALADHGYHMKPVAMEISSAKNQSEVDSWIDALVQKVARSHVDDLTLSQTPKGSGHGYGLGDDGANDVVLQQNLASGNPGIQAGAANTRSVTFSLFTEKQEVIVHEKSALGSPKSLVAILRILFPCMRIFADTILRLDVLNKASNTKA